jgi:hypothetical protein
MTNEHQSTSMEKKQFSNHYASRLLNRVLSDRKKADDKLNPADAAKYEVHQQEAPAKSVK